MFAQTSCSFLYAVCCCISFLNEVKSPPIENSQINQKRKKSIQFAFIFVWLPEYIDRFACFNRFRNQLLNSNKNTTPASNSGEGNTDKVCYSYPTRYAICNEKLMLQHIVAIIIIIYTSSKWQRSRHPHNICIQS